MKFGDLPKLGAGLVAGAIILSAGAHAAPVPPIPAQAVTMPAANVEPAVFSQNEVDQIKPIQVHWHHHHHWGHHYGWHHHRHWHHHYWQHRHRYHWPHHCHLQYCWDSEVFDQIIFSPEHI